MNVVCLCRDYLLYLHRFGCDVGSEVGCIDGCVVGCIEGNEVG